MSFVALSRTVAVILVVAAIPGIGLASPARAATEDPAISLSLLPGSDDVEIDDLAGLVYCAKMIALVDVHKQYPDSRLVSRMAGFSEDVLDPGRVPNWIRHRDSWVRDHERGHCLDRAILSVPDASDHRMHLAEAYADTFAALMLYRSAGDLRPIREAADLRAISVLVPPLAGAHDDLRWARYLTAPVLDHATAWIRGNETQLMALEGEDEIFALAQQLVHESAVPEADYGALVNALRETRLIENTGGLGRPTVAWHAVFPVADATRIEAALTRLGISNETLGRYVDSIRRTGAEGDAQ